jgi:hypothetical protein
MTALHISHLAVVAAALVVRVETALDLTALGKVV